MFLSSIRTRFNAITIFAAILGATVTSQSAGLPDIVASAKPLAASALQSLAYYKFQNTPLTNDEIHWLVFYRNELANDVSTVKHNWNVGNYQQCAWTRVEKLSAIEFSQNQCEPIIFAPKQATPILIQMSLIHYGISEQRSFVMSQVILSVAGMNPQPPNPTPNPVMDVFNPDICSGPQITPQEIISYFSPGEVRATPDYKVTSYTRQRYCNLSTGCSTWVIKEQELPTNVKKVNLSFSIANAATPIYEINVEDRHYNNPNEYCLTVENYLDLGLDSMYCGKSTSFLITNKCLYSKTYFASPKSAKGSFVEHELVYYGLLAPPKH